ncbi:MarR family winged helix-turn-helix transcriptional regulator [Phosphitispora sp. TUW77]|uniref:MarR family winged helix-turn-helix transcriptional regulator n=1 Tax=Phosphitispora sp. TUW77 TaxID=3152361 RepID=UPI003AB84390
MEGNAEKIYQLLEKFHKLKQNKKTSGDLPRSGFIMLKKIRMNSSENEGVTISALSELLQISKSAVSQMINYLENKGYVNRIITRSDRRLVYVMLTESGEQYLNKEAQYFMQGMAQIFAEMGKEDTEELLRLLEKLYLIVIHRSKQ